MAVLLRYPVTVVERLVDPFEGLVSRQNRLPTPFDIKQLAEEFMAPARRAEQRARVAATMAAERETAARIARERPFRPTIEEIEEDLAGKGLYLASYRRRCPWLFGTDGMPHGCSAETVREKFHLTPEEWAAIPDFPPQRPPQPERTDADESPEPPPAETHHG